MKALRQYLARRELAKIVRRQRALQADYRTRRDRSLTPDRKRHIQKVVYG